MEADFVALYWVAFEIDNDQGTEIRCNAIRAVVEEYSDKYWDQLPSFIVFRSQRPLEELAEYFREQIATDRDLVMVGEISSADAFISPRYGDEKIFDWMPNLRLV
jgi:hypothetical protein